MAVKLIRTQGRGFVGGWVFAVLRSWRRRGCANSSTTPRTIACGRSDARRSARADVSRLAAARGEAQTQAS